MNIADAESFYTLDTEDHRREIEQLLPDNMHVLLTRALKQA